MWDFPCSIQHVHVYGINKVMPKSPTIYFNIYASAYTCIWYYECLSKICSIKLSMNVPMTSIIHFLNRRFCLTLLLGFSPFHKTYVKLYLNFKTGKSMS